MSAPFTIDPASGRMRFPELNLELGPGTPEEDFVAATARRNRDNLGFNGGWQRYVVRELISDDRKLGMFFIFFEGHLNKLSVSWCQKDESWDNWTEAGELARQEEFQWELESQLGGKAEFPWGTARVILDSKSGGTDIWVDYSKAASGK
jgi:hypothetical protein